MTRKNIAILGSTGSIGTNVLRVVDRFSDRLNVVALTAFNNAGLLKKQITKYRPQYVAVERKRYSDICSFVKHKKVKVLDADRELEDIATLKNVDLVLCAVSGAAALRPFLAAVKKGKTVAPANKEALVMAGAIIMREAKKNKALILPVDSEQSAIFQCLNGNRKKELRHIYLTASGGSLYRMSKAQLRLASVEKVLKHPRWKMGRKITVDSATLMNKGLEVIEAKWLFGLEVDQIRVLIHPEAVIHSMVEFRDGSVLAQMGVTDMRLPIQYALTYPKRLISLCKPIDFVGLHSLTFEKPDTKKFPALDICYRALKKGGSLPVVLNAANEEAVKACLSRRLRFSKIISVVEKILSRHKKSEKPSIKEIWQIDDWTRNEARKVIG